MLDSGDFGGQLWFAMPYVEGESLYERLQRERQLPTAEALRIAFAVPTRWPTQRAGRGPSRYQARQHPALGRRRLVADFGVARAVSEMQSKLTATGMIVGTPTYMSPEQAAGELDLDGRSDIFALACVIYEMLAGEPPFKGPTPQMTLMLRLMQPARPLRPMVSVTEEVESAILRALAKDPADRWATAADFADALAGKRKAPPSPPPPSSPTPQPAPAAEQAAPTRFDSLVAAALRVPAAGNYRLLVEAYGVQAQPIRPSAPRVRLDRHPGADVARGGAALVGIGRQLVVHGHGRRPRSSWSRWGSSGSCVWLLVFFDRVLKATGKAARIRRAGRGMAV